MRRQQTFEAPTREKAEALADAFIKRHPGSRVIGRPAAHAGSGTKGTKIGTQGSWHIVIEYDDEPKPA